MVDGEVADHGVALNEARESSTSGAISLFGGTGSSVSVRDSAMAVHEPCSIRLSFRLPTVVPVQRCLSIP